MQTTREAFRSTTSDRTVNFDETIQLFLAHLGLVPLTSVDFVPFDRDEMLPEPFFLPHRRLILFAESSSVNGAWNQTN